MQPPTSQIRSVFKQPIEDQYDQLPALIDDSTSLLAGASRGSVAAVLQTVADVLNVTLPSEDALAIYYSLLEEYPEDLLRIGAREVCRTYKWPSFPKPADFINQIQPHLAERKSDLAAAIDRYSLIDRMYRRTKTQEL